MGRQVKILKKRDWFLGKDSKQDYPINYRYVICYALLSLLSRNGFDKKATREKLHELEGSINSGRHFLETGFLEVIALEGEWGLVVVDQSGGIYPLILYSNKRQGGNVDERITAFENSLEDVIQNYNAIFSYFQGHSLASWDQNFQEGLFEAAKFNCQTIS